METIAGYEHAPGDHCGSTSLRNLAEFYDWNLDEPACLGVGSGLGFTYFEPGESPWRVFFGRPTWVERAFFEHLGVGYEHRRGEDWADAWGSIRAHVDEGRPVTVYADIAHLDYFGTNTHFSPHTLVVVGHGDGEVLVSDSEFDALQRVPVERFRAAVTTDHVYPLDAEYFVVTDPAPTRSFEAAAREAVAETARYMVDPAEARFSLGRPPVAEGDHGIEGVRAFAEELPEFTALPDPSWSVHFAYQTVELRGTGGGTFRRLYADFLEVAADRVPAVPDDAGRRLRAVADDWTAVGHLLKEASKRDDEAALREDLETAAGEVEAIADREAAIFRDVATALEPEAEAV